MARLLTIAAILVPLAACFAAAPPPSAPELPTGLRIDGNLPSSFQPYNVNAVASLSEEPDEPSKAKSSYTSKGKFHSLVTEYDLDPVVMLVVKGLEEMPVSGICSGNSTPPWTVIRRAVCAVSLSFRPTTWTVPSTTMTNARRWSRSWRISSMPPS